MLLVNYGVHSTLWGGTQYLSADFPGEAMRFVEERSQTGEYEARREDTVALFMQGCCGDVSPAWPGLSPNWPGRPIYSKNGNGDLNSAASSISSLRMNPSSHTDLPSDGGGLLDPVETS